MRAITVAAAEAPAGVTKTTVIVTAWVVARVATGDAARAVLEAVVGTIAGTAFESIATTSCHLRSMLDISYDELPREISVRGLVNQ